MSTLVSAQYSEKGGVGKTSITTGMAATAAEDGARVIVVDADPRASATEELGVVVGPQTLTLNDLLYVPEDADPVDPAEAIGDVLLPAGEHWPGTVRVIAAERQLAHRETDPHAIEGRLARGLAALDGEADLVLIDLPPRAGGKLVTTGLTAATHVVIPTMLTTDGYSGVAHARRSLRLIRQGANPGLTYAGIVRSIVPRESDRRAVHDQIDTDLAEDFPGEVVAVQITEYAIREDARYTSFPITRAPGREAKILADQYRALLDHLRSTGGIRV
ncbi:ParA family protein (plasmid) [Actinomadura graeca]|uniref:ParA family protein n=1 Tax=Actinomadura graeca TaxID=2750812 RepID=A0ABX8R9B5_9ACTN|nr:ParA family protein [Actinomadura graeca]QXJ27064.1 ParA family protein [Actinomadura graeca]